MDSVVASSPVQSPPAVQVLGDLMSQRFSCRSFEARPVPRETIRKIVELAQRTASWCNAQPWKVYLASGETIERLRTAMHAHAATHAPEPDLAWPREYRGVYRERRRECGWGLYESLGIARDDRVASARQALENFRMFDAPHVAIVTSDEALGTYGAIDCGAYTSNFLLAAHSLGVASIAQAALASYPRLLREHLDIGSDRLIVCGISFGYANEAHAANRFRTRRADPADCVVWVD